MDPQKEEAQPNQQSRNIVLKLLILLFAITGWLTAGYLFLTSRYALVEKNQPPKIENNEKKINNLISPTSKITIDALDEKTASPDKNNLPAMIEGSLSFPSEGIPSDLQICAENITTSDSYCTSQQLKDSKYTYGIGYQLEVPEGKYYVYAYPASNQDFRAYYSEFVTCGLEYTCPSHDPIVVEAKTGKTTNNIDPADWYNSN